MQSLILEKHCEIAPELMRVGILISSKLEIPRRCCKDVDLTKHKERIVPSENIYIAYQL